MTILPHVAAGAVLGSFLPNILTSIIGGAVSHIVVDMLPHWDPTLKHLSNPKKLLYAGLLLLDLSLSLGLLVFLLPFPTMFWGGLFGGLVDLENFLHLHWLEKIGIKTHAAKGTWQTQVSFWPGIISQAVFTGLMLVVILIRIITN